MIGFMMYFVLSEITAWVFNILSPSLFCYLPHQLVLVFAVAFYLIGRAEVEGRLLLYRHTQTCNIHNAGQNVATGVVPKYFFLLTDIWSGTIYTRI